jgi:hypothetical protein
MSDDLAARCFFDENAPLAVPQFDRERALAYLGHCYSQGLTWDDAAREMTQCLAERGVPPEGIARQLKIAGPLLRPWLD